MKTQTKLEKVKALLGKSKTFKIQFKQDGQWWHLENVPIDRLEAAMKIKRYGGVCGIAGLHYVECRDCPWGRMGIMCPPNSGVNISILNNKNEVVY